jgi:hypothetical protein
MYGKVHVADSIQQCGTRLWKEISSEEVELIRPMLPGLKGNPSDPPQCLVKTQKSSILTRLVKNVAYTVSVMSRGQQKTSTNASGPAISAGTNVQPTGSGQLKNNPSHPPQHQGTSSAGQPHISASTSSTPSSKRWILFGVQGSRLSMELEHIEIDDYINDSRFYRTLREHYQKHRGKLKLWFSIWRLGFCDGVKVWI